MRAVRALGDQLVFKPPVGRDQSPQTWPDVVGVGPGPQTRSSARITSEFPGRMLNALHACLRESRSGGSD
jgi:hypothetical protein